MLILIVYQQQLYSDSAHLVTLINADHIHQFFVGMIPFVEHYLQLRNCLIVAWKTTIADCEQNAAIKFEPSDRAFHPAFKRDYLDVVQSYSSSCKLMYNRFENHMQLLID